MGVRQRVAGYDPDSELSGRNRIGFAGGLTLTPLADPVSENPTAVPEPATMLLMGTGLLLAFKKTRQRV